MVDRRSSAIQLLLDGEVDVAMAYNARIQTLIDQGSSIKIEWNDGLVPEDSWVVLKGGKNTTNAMKFVAFASRATVQAALADLFPYNFP